MFTFEALENETGSVRVSKLSFDADTNILADPSWDGKNPDDIDFLETKLANISVILLSHGTPEFLGGYVLLWIKFPVLMSNISVYSTVPVNQLGRIATVELYRSQGHIGPLDTAILEVNQVDEAFDKITSLKFLQTIYLFDNKLIVTPYNAGHTLGGTFWLMTKKIEKIVYAPAWNHSKDSFLNSASFLAPNGTPLAQLVRPTALITNTDLGSGMSHKKRTEKFLQLVDATLANGGSVLLPTSLSGRFLELLHLIDQHLQSAPIPVLFLSYSGTKALSYASNLLEWMSSSLIKEWEEVQSHGASSKNNIPFDPSKVDLLADASELVQLTGPKVVFCTGLDLLPGDKSTQALQYLCNDEKTTIILTEKTQLHIDDTNINAQLYREWYNLAKQRSGTGMAEDGVPVPLEKIVTVVDAIKEEPLQGLELTQFQEKVTNNRKQLLLEKVRDKKNKNLLSNDNFSDSSSDEDEESSSEDEEEEEEEGDEKDQSRRANNIGTGVNEAETSGSSTKPDKNKLKEGNQNVGKIDGNGTTDDIVKAPVDELEAHEALITDHIKQKLNANEPLDLKITKKMKTRQAMFPYFPTAHKRKFDDYGEIIDIKNFQKTDEMKNRHTIDGGASDEEDEWGRGGAGGGAGPSRRHKRFNTTDASNKLTPQEILNNEVLKKNLDTLFAPQKRIKLPPIPLRVRCGLSFVDLAGLVDFRSLSLIVSLIKPFNIVLLKDQTSKIDEIELNSLAKVKKSFESQEQSKKEKNFNKSLIHSARFMSLENIRGELSGFSGKLNNQMDVLVAEKNQSLKIGYDDDGVAGLGLTNFEVKLDDGLLENLKWQTIDGSYKVAQVYGELEIANSVQPSVKKAKKDLGDYINSSTQFTLKHLDPKQYYQRKLKVETQEPNINGSIVPNSLIPSGSSAPGLGPKLAIGNIRLTELKKKLQHKNLNAEFKSEGTLVVNDILAIRKVTYGSSEGDDTGDIVIDGHMGPLYYQVKDCIREMLAYI